tara:strand:- start:9917 stop:12907 length:2991 start_codon:yes stop_codon:yes gene_type:complete
MADAVKAALVAAAIAGIIVATGGAAPAFFGSTAIFGLGAGTAASFVAFTATMAFVTTGLQTMMAPSIPSATNQNFGTKVASRSANAPRQIVYGQCRVGGTITHIETTGTTNDVLHLFIAVAGHTINSLEKVIINETVLTLGSDTSASTINGTTVNTVTHSNFTNTENEQNFGSGRLIRFTFNDGSQTTKNAFAQAQLGTTSVPNTHVFKDVAYVYMQCVYDPEVLPNVPNLSFVVKGKNVFDPRTNAVANSDLQRSNPALIIRDFLTDTTYGLKAVSDEINDTTSAGGFAAAANTCDQDVTLADGSTTETRYTANGFTDMSADGQDVLGGLLSSMAGSLTYANGKFNVFAGANQSPSLTITDDDVLQAPSITTKTATGEIFNTVKASFVDEENKFVVADAPVFQSSTFLTQDTPSGETSANFVKTMELKLPFTTTHTAAQRLGKIALLHNRQTTSIQLVVPLKFLRLQTKDYVRVTNERMGFDSKLFEVLTVSFTSITQDDIQILACQLDLKEIESAVYDFATNEYSTPIQQGTVVNTGDNSVPTPSSASASQSATVEGTTTKINISVTWTNSTEIGIQGTEVQYKLSGDSNYSSLLVGKSQSVATIPNVTVGQTYNIRLRHFTYDNVYSSVVALSDLTITAVTAIPATPTNLAVASDNPLLIGVSWTNPSNTDLRAVKVYRKTVDNTPTSDSDGLVETIYGEPGQKSLFFFGKQDGLSAGTTYFFWLRAVNHSGVNSAFTSSVSGSFKNIVAGDVDTTFSNTIAFKSNLTDGATVISGSNIQTGTLNADRIGTGTLNGSNVTVTNLNASNITGGTLSVNRIGANSLNIASKGVLGSAGNIKSGSGQIQQTTNSTGAVNQFFGDGNSLLSTFAASSPFHKSGSTSLGEIASVSFSTPSNTATYNFLGFHGLTGTFGGDEEKLIVLSIQTSSGTVLNDTFQYVNGDLAPDLFGLALTQSLSGNSSFVARLYAGTKNVDTSGGVLRITGTVMAFGLGL